MARTKEFIQNNNNNAICYYRYSSDAQRECSIEQQQEEAHKFCKLHGYTIIKEYADKAMSGTIADRPEYQLMLHEVKHLRPAVLVVWKTDRLSRDRYESVIVKKELRDCGVKIEYVAEAIPDDDGLSIMYEAILEASAEYYVHQLRQNVRRGMQFNAEKALYNGRRILGYIGQQDKRYEIDAETAPVVQKIFNDYVDGKSMKVIADELNTIGYRTIQGKMFTEKSLWHTLHNRSYIGEYRWNDIIIPDGFPRLVSDEVFEKAQEMMEKNKHGRRGSSKKNNPEAIDFWLTGHLFCGECGAQMSGVSANGRSRKYYYYTCVNNKKHICDKKRIQKDVLELAITRILNECINDASLRLLIANRVYDYYMREFGSDDSYEKSLQASIKDVETKLNNIMKAIEAGIFNETTQQRMQELQERKNAYNEELIAEQNRQQYALKKEHIVRYLECFVGSLDVPSVRENVLSFLIEKIYVYDDKIVLNMYYSEDAREVDFVEMNKYYDNIDNIMRVLSDDSVDTTYQDKL